MLDPQFELLSIGRACQLAGLSPGRLAEAGQALGILPSGKINGVSYYAAADVERIAAHLARVKSAERPMINHREPSF